MLAGQGRPAGAIAIMTGCSEGHVRRELRVLGYDRQPIPAGEELAMAYDRAGSIRRLAAELGCSAGRVKNALERDGIRRLPKTAALVAMVREMGGRRTAGSWGAAWPGCGPRWRTQGWRFVS
ncbi:helix-turn-helix domain-containing protein [Nonomuraea sp. NPDC003707]